MALKLLNRALLGMFVWGLYGPLQRSTAPLDDADADEVAALEDGDLATQILTRMRVDSDPGIASASGQPTMPASSSGSLRGPQAGRARNGTDKGKARAPHQLTDHAVV